MNAQPSLMKSRTERDWAQYTLPVVSVLAVLSAIPFAVGLYQHNFWLAISCGTIFTLSLAAVIGSMYFLIRVFAWNIEGHITLHEQSNRTYEQLYATYDAARRERDELRALYGENAVR